MKTRRDWPFLLFSLGILLIFTGFMYDVWFGGIPYPDPTPAMSAKYDFHSQIASIIRWSGAGFILLSGTSLIIKKTGLSKFKE